jgi:Fibronectin type III domain
MSEDSTVPPSAEQTRPEAFTGSETTRAEPVFTPPSVRRRRRGWILALSGVVVAGLVAGLLVWEPWHQSPVAPTAVFATSRTATSVLVSWPASKGGATPDHYLVLRDGKQVGSVLASRTSFTDNGLAPGSRHRYAIIAEAGGQKSAASVKVATVTTITPSPVGLKLSKATWTTVTLRWAPSPLGPAPDKYQIYSGSNLVGTVGGSADSYVATGLTAGGTYTYQVDAVWGQAVSALSAPVTALTLAPPLSGSVPVNFDTTSTPGSGASLSVGDHWSDTWQFAPDCVSTGCSLTADAELAAPGFATKQFTVKLHGSGRSYRGSAKAQISACGSVDVTNTVTLSIKAGAVTNGGWATWTGAMQVTSPYTTVGDEFCPTQSWSFSIKGTS